MDEHTFEPPSRTAVDDRPLIEPVAPAAPTAPGHRWSRRRIVGGIVTAVALVGIGALLVGMLARDTADGAGFSVAAAAAATASQDVVAYELTVSMGGASGDAIRIFAVLDAEQQMMSMQVSVPTQATDDLEMIVDLDNGVVYLGGMAGLGFPVVAEWVSVDLEQLADLAGQDLPGFGDLGLGNPLDAAWLLAVADDTREVGRETIDGEDVLHVVVTVDPRAALEARPELIDRLGEQFLDALDRLPAEIVYDVWVTEDDQLRRLAYELESVSFTMDMRPVDETVVITAPPADRTVDIGNLLDLFGQSGD